MQRKVTALLCPHACHCGLVACLWHGPPGKKDVGFAALFLWLSAAGPVMSVWGALCDLRIALLSHTMLPRKRKGCRLLMATAQEMKNKGSF